MTETDTFIGRISKLRRRFEPPETTPSRWDVPRKILRFTLAAVKKAHADDLALQSAALAFITIVALVPLLAAFSFIGARAFTDQQEVMVELLSQLLPFSEETILEYLREFLEEARKIRGIGFLFFLVTSMTAFMTIERTVNQIWNVPARRPFRIRLLSFTMVLFWGSLVIGAVSLGLVSLREQSTFQNFAEALPAPFLPFIVRQFIPFVVSLLGLSMLYWQVPYTTVRFRNAFAGGLIAALLLEGLRQGFGLYIETVRTVSIIYGSLGAVLLFMISIQLTWWIVLLGSEAAYCIQHRALMLRPRRHAAALEGSWLGVAALAFIGDRFRAGRPITPHALLADQLQLPAEELLHVLTPLIENGLLQETGGETEGYILSCDSHDLELTRIFEQYEGPHWRLLESLPEGLAANLEDLRARLAAARDQKTDGLMVAELVKCREPEAEPSATGAANGDVPSDVANRDVPSDVANRDVPSDAEAGE
ncbi:MAG: YihY/virulence factor BrkB family protein [bacterium]|nr:YihY/virulence factor BrkB family protein [bacterium]